MPPHHPKKEKRNSAGTLVSSRLLGSPEGLPRSGKLHNHCSVGQAGRIRLMLQAIYDVLPSTQNCSKYMVEDPTYLLCSGTA